MASVIVGVDPGKECGVVCLAGRVLAWRRTIRGDLLRNVVTLIQAVKAMADEHGTATLVIELQYGARGHRQNLKALESLYRRRHTWEIMAEVYGIRVVQVWPSTWQASQLASAAKYDARGRKRDTKERSIEVASRIFGGDNWTDAEADAGLIARWYLDQPRQERML